MASIINKKVKNYKYYYYVESKRVNGKPTLVNQKYLGTADRILEMTHISEQSLQERALYSDAAEFGAVALVYDIASRLGIVDIIDGILPKRKQGASVGVYILTAAINRATSPSSKSGLAEWYSGTCLPMLTGLKPTVFTPQNFWNNTCISATELDRIEEAVLEGMLDTYDIDTTQIIYDATNFFTYIDTMQDSELAKRGHNKEKRNDLRIVGLSMMVSPDHAIPLLHDTYPGNMSDAKEFPVMVQKLKARYEAITKKPTDITIVFDRGNNSEDNIALLDNGDVKLHYVGGLKKNQAAELYEIDLGEYDILCSPSLEGQLAYRTEIEVFGRRLTVVITYNPELEEGQMQGILINIEKTCAKLLDLQQRLMRWANGEITKGKRPTKDSVTKAVEKILAAEYMSEVFLYEVIESGGNVHLLYRYSDVALEDIRRVHLGKTVLFTDRKDFTNEQIVSAYRNAWHVEKSFKQMKDTKHLTVRPMFHWTDEKIRVHIFTCVLAYRLCSLLVKELDDKGVSISIDRLIDEMSRIMRINTFFGDINKPERVTSFTRGNDVAQQIASAYRLKEKYC
jgi:transposase